MDRRESILELLLDSKTPMNGSELGEIFQVSRQVIVQDIAILRASGNNIISTNRGYMMDLKNSKIQKQIVSNHRGFDEMKDELNIIVDHGGKIIDVMVDHQIYGELKARLEIGNRIEVEEFLNSLIENKAEPLSLLTEGVHMHTIEVENLDMFKKIENALEIKGYLTK